MSSRKRVLTALAHRQPDRTPLFEYILLPPVAADILGRKYVDYAGGGPAWLEFVQEAGFDIALKRYVNDRLDLAAKLGHDMLYIVPNPLPEQAMRVLASSAGSPAGPDDPVERLRLRNQRQDGLLEEQKTDRYLVYSYMREAMAERGVDLPIMAPAYAHGIKTDTDLMETILLEPDVAREHFQNATARSLERIRHLLAAGVEQIGVGGDFAGNRLIISPQAYAEFIVPELRKVTDVIHSHKAIAINASDGNLWEVIDDFLLNTGVDGYIEIDMRAGMDLPRLKKLFGQQIIFYGNMDCGEVLSFGTPEEIRSQTISCLEAGLGDGGHIFTASNAIIGSVPVANYLAMVNAYKAYFSLPPVRI